ncbi:MAG: hypothetical protein AAGC81_12635 [Pseudomonadota bacterium]
MRITAFVAAAALTVGQVVPAYAEQPVNTTQSAPTVQSTQTVEEGGLSREPLDEIGNTELAIAVGILALLGAGLAIGLGGGNSDSTSAPNTN